MYLRKEFAGRKEHMMKSLEECESTALQETESLLASDPVNGRRQYE